MTSTCIAERFARQAEPVLGGGGAAEETKLGLQEGAWLFAAVAIPLVLNPTGVQVFDLPKIALLRTVVIAMAALWLWRRLSAHRVAAEHGARVPWSDPILWAGALGLVYTTAALVSPDVGLSFWGSYSRQEGLYTTLVYLLLFALVATEMRQPKQAERLALAIALGSLPIVLYGLFQVAGLDPIPWQTLDKSPALATIGRSNFVGSYLAMSIPLSIAALVSSRRPWLRGALALVVLASLALLALTNARAAWVAIVVAGLALLALSGWHKGGWRNVAPYAGLACAALVVFAAAYLATLWMAGLIQPGNLLRVPELSGSLAARVTIWEASLQLVAERPLLGFGPDGFYLAFYHVFPPQLVFYQGRGLVTDRAHDVFLQQAVNAGLLGLAVYIALLATLIAKLVRGRHLSVRHGRVVAAAMLAAALGHLVDLLFSFDVASTAVVFWIVAGAGVGLTRQRAENRVLPSADAQMPTGGLPKWRRAAAGTFVAAALAIVLGSSVLPLVADTFAGRSLRPGVPLAERLDDAARAVGIWPFEPAHRAGLGRHSAAVHFGYYVEAVLELGDLERL